MSKIKEQNLATFIAVGKEKLNLAVDKLDTSRRSNKTKVLTQSIHGIFRCKKCGRQWTSHHFIVDFWFKIVTSTEPSGEDHYYVAHKYYGQKCKRCKGASYIVGKFLNKNRLKAIWEKICTPKREKTDDDNETKENKKSGPPHKSELCEACSKGKCRDAGDSDITEMMGNMSIDD